MSKNEENELSFVGDQRIIRRIKTLIRNDVKVNRFFSNFKMVIENNQNSNESAMMVLALLAADPVESENLIRTIREPRDRSYEKSY